MATNTTNNQGTTAWERLPERTRDILGGVGWAILVFFLLAVFVVEGVGPGLVWTVIALLIVIAVKVTKIAKAAKR